MPAPPAALLTKLFAEERKYELNTASDIKDALKENYFSYLLEYPPFLIALRHRIAIET